MWLWPPAAPPQSLMPGSQDHTRLLPHPALSSLQPESAPEPTWTLGILLLAGPICAPSSSPPAPLSLPKSIPQAQALAPRIYKHLQKDMTLLQECRTAQRALIPLLMFPHWPVPAVRNSNCFDLTISLNFLAHKQKISHYRELDLSRGESCWSTPGAGPAGSCTDSCVRPRETVKKMVPFHHILGERWQQALRSSSLCAFEPASFLRPNAGSGSPL